MKSHLREKAIAMRMEGKSYSEILAEVPIVKSTLWTWVKGIELPELARERIRERKAANLSDGTAHWHDMRVRRTEQIRHQAEQDVGELSPRELWLVGAALYWAEGSKEKERKPGSPVIFNNSDPGMIILFRRWLVEACMVSAEDIRFDLTLHQESKSRVVEMLDFWNRTLGCDHGDIRVHYKHIRSGTSNRSKKGNDYVGMLRVRVRNSSTLLRKTVGWRDGLCKA